jgi:uncharacterized repeat protein (TIGR01451 family)
MFITQSKSQRAVLACATLAALLAAPGAYAAGTAAGTDILNRATVSYSVGSTAQTPIESSPSGNSTPGAGAGANTRFVVDNRVNLTVAEVGGAATVVNPGQPNVVAVFSVTNNGNAPQAYQLAVANLTGTTLFTQTDNADVGNLRVFVDANANGTYEPATDVATSIATLAADAGVQVLVVADVPATASNGQYANVRLTATTALNNTPATVLTQTAGADRPDEVDVVFGDAAGAGDAARDGLHSADDQYAVQSASLTITKASSIISDPFNGTGADRKAIPGAIVEYAITIQNTGTIAATGISIGDPVPANTAFVTGGYNAGASDVSITQAATTSFCVAEAGGTDSNGDGCVRSVGGTLTVGGAAMPATIPGAGPSNTVVVRFRVSIN